MKTFKLNSLLAALLMVTAVSCNEDDAVYISQYVCTFPADGGTTTVQIGASRKDWVAKPDDNNSWYSFNETSFSITLTARANETDRERRSVITITAGDVTTRLTLVQEAGAAIPGEVENHLDVSPAGDIFYIPNGGGKLVFSVVSPLEWKIEGADYFTTGIDYGQNLLTVAAEALHSGQRKEETLTISSGPDEDRFEYSFKVVQLSAAEDGYYSLLGNWDLWSGEWYFQFGYPADVSLTSCVILENRPYRSVTIRDLFMDETVVEAVYDPSTEELYIPLGDKVLHFNYDYYLMALNFEPDFFSDGYITAKYNHATGNIDMEVCPVVEGAYGIGLAIDYGDVYFYINEFLPYTTGQAVWMQRTPAVESVGKAHK